MKQTLNREQIEKERGKLIEKEFTVGLTSEEEQRMKELVAQINELEKEDIEKIKLNYKIIKKKKSLSKKIKLFLEKVKTFRRNHEKDL